MSKISGKLASLLVLVSAAIFFVAYLVSANSGNVLHRVISSVPKHGNLVFHDEFNGLALDTSKWVTCYDWYHIKYDGCSNDGNNELEWYRSSQVSETKGVLSLTAVQQPALGWNGKYEQPYAYQSGMISTGRPSWNDQIKSSYTYGYFVARMKTPSGKGIWPAFWLSPANKTWPPEIDIMEILGDKPNNVLMTTHWGTVYSPQKDVTHYQDLKDPNGWHTYAIDWRFGRIDWYIDNIKRKSFTGANVPNTPMEVIANLAVGGNLPGSPNSSTHFPATLQIDYIRIYKNS